MSSRDLTGSMCNFYKTDKALFFIMLADIIGIILTFIFNSTIISDEQEHLRASYLVSLGDVPYRDFFEHHHPLLWYVFAPIVALLPHNAILLFYVAKTLALLCSALTFYIIFLIFRHFLGGKLNFYYFMAIALLFYPLWYNISIFKPDTFARLFYFCGLYFFMGYIEQRRLKELVLCGLAFVVAFLFLQTIAFSILPLPFAALWLFYKNPQFYKHAAIAAVLPCAILLSAVAAAYYSGALIPYWQENVIFNAHLFQYLHSASAPVLRYWLIYIAAGIAAGVWQYKKQPSVYYILIFWLFICEILQHIYFPAIFPHYLVLLFTFLAMLIAPIAQTISPIVRNYIVAFLVVGLSLNFATLYLKNNIEYMKGYKIVNADSQQNIAHVNFNFVNIYAPKQTFYTLVPHHFAWLDNFLFNRFPAYDVNRLIQNPTFVYLDYLPEKNKVPQKLYHERFVLSDENLQNFEQISHGLYRRITPESKPQ